MPELMTLAGVQMDVTLGEPQKNVERMLGKLDEAGRQGAELVVFPECAVTGYCFESLEEAVPFGETFPGETTAKIGEHCRRLGLFAIYGTLERSADRLFNAAVCLGPDGIAATYRKVHLPHLGVDFFTTPGDRPWTVHAVRDLSVGMNICYDSAFPEAARTLALAGADLIALPTNFPPGAECMLGHVIHARAMENSVYFAAINRVGSERDFRFLGRSKICDPDGRAVAEGPADEETILYAQIDIRRARNKRRVRVPDRHFIDRFADRRPEFYTSLTD